MRADLTAEAPTEAPVAVAVPRIERLRERLRIVRYDISVRYDRIRRSMLRTRGELLTIGATLAGWSLVTSGIASLTRGPVWRFSAGLLLLSTCGWEFLAYIAWRGFYQLTRRRPDA